MNLVLVESPAKAKTIAKYLNAAAGLSMFGKFEVMASMGHVRDLEKKGLGIDVEAGFVPQYHVTPEKEKVVRDIRDKLKSAKMVWLASDFDREGEGIAMHLKELFNLRNYKRITFTEITPSALEHAILHPRDIDMHLVDAQETRRILDRLVGFKLSPLLWKMFKTENMSGLSAGRVQSAVLHIIIEKERAIQRHETSSYWSIGGSFLLELDHSQHVLEDVKLYDGSTIYKDENVQHVKGVLQGLAKAPRNYVIDTVKTRVSRTNADMPFITSTLQQEASSKFGFTLKRTMMLAQELYEKGHITYMRTDSYNIAEDFAASAKAYITGTYGTMYLRDQASLSKSSARKRKNAQEAHEAIRPTKVKVTTVKMSSDHCKLYEMIWKRTVAYFMTACVRDNLDIHIRHHALSKDMFFACTVSKIKFNGYMAVYGVQTETYNFQSTIDALQSKGYSITHSTITARNTWSTPPQRFTESSIIRVLESEGIGRPSTYASIMGKLLEKRYVVKNDVKGIPKDATHFVLQGSSIKSETTQVMVGHEQSKIVPTNIGEEIDAFLTSHFAYIVDAHFTANMEADLDRIANGTADKHTVLNVFWKTFGKDVESLASTKVTKQMLKTESQTLVVAGREYKVRYAKYGPVIEYLDPDSDDPKKKRFINLKPYLKMFRKELSDVSVEDVELLRSMPREIATVKRKPFILAYGPYGFYGQYDGANIRLPIKTVYSVLRGDINKDDLVSAIEYKEKKASTNSK